MTSASAITTALTTLHITTKHSHHLLLPRSSQFISSSSLLTNNSKLVIIPWMHQTRHLHVIAAETGTRKKPTSEQPSCLSFVNFVLLVASRRSCEELIFDGRVTVNGSVCNTPQTKVDPKKDMIYVNGNRLPKKLPPKVYLALNKPKGYICSSAESQTKSVISLFDDYMKSWDKRNPGQPKPRLFTVGRLDVATTGLIIVTNDGEFAQKISHPSSGLSKEYIATIDGAVNKRHLIAISEGTVVDGVRCIPDAVELLPQQPDKSRPRLRIVVHEGRNHEVRELVKSAGLQIYSLKRIRIGAFRLPPDLLFGKHIELKPPQLKALGWGEK
ncbi:pseudouridine synthase, RluC/RluD [Artemisia annua]|uniref:Pseudouridine synthase, RluC/RluD n=1 Tax=Artemisia annua TaxID=35608 RepID=A0A2U1P0H1_ARTAN|nr:pseudouridine synthase, RluC/RluD [Artemisia annua]